MTYILDTNICIYWLKGDKNIEAKASEVGLGNLSISFITLGELYYGAFKSQRIKDNILNIEKLKDKLIVIESNSLICEMFGKFKASLLKKGNVIDDADIFVAACAMVKKATVVTNNERHFKCIRGLKSENWARNKKCGIRS